MKMRAPRLGVRQARSRGRICLKQDQAVREMCGGTDRLSFNGLSGLTALIEAVLDAVLNLGVILLGGTEIAGLQSLPEVAEFLLDGGAALRGGLAMAGFGQLTKDRLCAG